ncbi:MAG: hypothetical protein DI598_02340 [Pseudopedobacter saltans]|uniref:Uncharacterized protein n=1 Tax=Pseudopedobacter saltans TaxID=151895 RepID=A0A2W5FBY9_9SPHI|nr:MAG: hypothetical protein DI598_02340 [Pseudopedobacter saltans]
MRTSKQILLILTVLVSLCIQKSFAAFVIEDDGSKKENKYSLKQLHRQEAPYSLSSLSKKKWEFEFNKGNYPLSLPPVNAIPANSVEVQSPVMLQKGHTLYIYNYKYKVQGSNPLPMFKAPSVSDYR